MTGDLVKRLREDGYNGHNPLCLAAADRIEALEAENERLRGVLQKIADRARALRHGTDDTDDWFELADLEAVAIAAALGEEQ